jgi:pimeloyl-ACP methyl ester carboxylesterase
MARSMKKTRPAGRRRTASGDGADWAFHATNSAVFEALATQRHGDSLREFFGTAAYEELSVLARAARRVKTSGGARVLLIPGMMGSRLCDMSAKNPRERGCGRMLWIDPASIASGRLTHLALPSRRTIRPRGVLLSSYARLKLRLAIEGLDARFFAYDWRLGIDEIGAALAAAIATGKPAVLIAHSMGALAARIAIKRLPKRSVRRLIMLGAPNGGSLAPVLALRGTYPFVQKLSRLDLEHSPDYLATEVFSGFPGLYHMLPPQRDSSSAVDLLDPASWPSDGVRPRPALLARVAQARAGMAEPDARMVQIVGVNRQTVVSVRRTAAGFEYGSTPHGDGTVPLAMAQVPGLETFYAEESHGNLASSPRIVDAIVDLIRSGTTRGLCARWAPQPVPEQRIDDVQLRAIDATKIDWRRLDSAQREAVMADLDGPEEPTPGSASAASLA